MSQRQRVGVAIAIGAAIALVAVGCGDDDGDEGGTDTTASLERYCELTRELDQAGEEKFEALEQDPNATREDFEAAERELVEENEDALAEIQEVAPSEIKGDVATLAQALRARAGLAEEVPAESEAAERRINRFERENCE